jgi:ABC-type nitrate/sulfonate/bicarbonate transport system substrate-binding protein
MRLARTGVAAAFALALLSGGLLGTDAASAADPIKIRLSYVVPIANWASMLVEKKDLAKNLGKSYQIEVTRFAGTPPMITALAAGELDIADLAYLSVPIAIQNAGMDLRVIAITGRQCRLLQPRVRLPPTLPGARSTSRCAPCCASTG